MYKAEENNTFRSRRNHRTSGVLRRRAFLEECFKTFEESNGTMKQSYRTNPLFIGGEGSRNRLDMTVAHF
jgi:hypothetical protein